MTMGLLRWHFVTTILMLHMTGVLTSHTIDLPHTTLLLPTRLGPIMGLNISTESGHMFQFRGIPFAKPPLGELRFRKPEAPNAWNGTYDGTSYGHSCMQYGLGVSEDCLYLNIYVPNSLDLSQRRAVMVWIHGGSFISGKGSIYDGSSLALLGNVVIVTINYRLNIFGFYSTGDNAASGNYGIWDQMLALRWVKDNIDDYTGDPTKITIFGESAGGVSVGLQAIIAQNKGIFQRVIAQSGSSLGPRDSGVEGMKVFDKVVKQLNCSVDPSASTVACLRSTNAHDLLSSFYDAFNAVQTDTFTMLSALGPMIDGELFHKDHEAVVSDSESYAMKFFRSLDYMAGMTSAEAGLFYLDLLQQQERFPSINFTVAIPSDLLCDHIIPTLVHQLYADCEGLSDEICQKYSTPRTTDSVIQTDRAASLYSDVTIYSSTVRTLDAHTGTNATTFQYLFSHEPRWSLLGNRPLWHHGPNHADEIPFVFGLKEFYPGHVPITDKENDISERMMTYWTNFAKTGNPNGDDPPALSGWPEYTQPYKRYLNISVTDSVGQTIYTDRMSFWNRDVVSRLKQCRQTTVISVNMLLTILVCIVLILLLFR